MWGITSKVLQSRLNPRGIGLSSGGTCSYNIGTTASESIQPLWLGMYLVIRFCLCHLGADQALLCSEHGRMTSKSDHNHDLA